MRRYCIAAALALVALFEGAARADPIDDYVRAQMKAFGLPGVSFAIVENGRITKIAAYGVANVARHTPATPETVYKICSVSKQFIATAIMVLGTRRTAER